MTNTISKFISDLMESIRLLFTKSGKSRTILDAETAARIRVQKLLDYDNGIQEPYLTKLIDEQFYGGGTRTFLKMQLNIRNVVRYLADVVPMTFKSGIVIDAENPQDEEKIQDILEDNRFDNLLKTLDRMVFLCKTVFIKVGWRNDRIVLDLITPQYVKIKSDDLEPYEISEIAYPIKLETLGDMTQQIMSPKGTFGYWTNSNFMYVDQDGRPLNNPENTDDVNPYGIIPIVTFREKECINGTFWQLPGDELLSAQDNINIKLTFRNYLIKRFSIPIPVLTSANILGNNTLILDGSAPVVVLTDRDNPGGGFKWETPLADIQKITDSINEEMRNLMILYGIDPNQFIFSADRQSAVSMVLGNAKLDERRESAKLSYQYSIEELLEVIKVVWDTHNPNDKFTEDDFTVKIQDPSLSYPSTTDKWLDIENRLKYNFDSPADILMELRNDISSTKDAQEIILHNSNLNKLNKLSSLFSMPMPPVKTILSEPVVKQEEPEEPELDKEDSSTQE